MTKRESSLIYIIKGIAVLSIVSAHCTLSQRTIQDRSLLLLRNIVSYFGEFGVPVFLVMSGYLFRRKKNIWEFILNKGIKIILPWFFCATLVWSYMIVQGDSYKLFPWILGVGNVYWYMPMLLVFFLLFYYIRNRYAYIILLFLTIVWHIIVYDFGYSIGVSKLYIIGNVLQFMPFFIMGIILQDKKYKLSVIHIMTKKSVQVVSIIIIGGLIVYSQMVYGEINYTSPMFLLFSISAMGIVFNIALVISKNGFCNKVIRVGQDSYFIYLIHLPLAGIISNLLSRNIITSYFIVIYPIIIIVFLEICLYGARKLCQKRNISMVFILTGAPKY